MFSFSFNLMVRFFAFDLRFSRRNEPKLLTAKICPCFVSFLFLSLVAFLCCLAKRKNTAKEKLNKIKSETKKQNKTIITFELNPIAYAALMITNRISNIECGLHHMNCRRTVFFEEMTNKIKQNRVICRSYITEQYWRNPNRCGYTRKTIAN